MAGFSFSGGKASDPEAKGGFLLPFLVLCASLFLTIGIVVYHARGGVENPNSLLQYLVVGVYRLLGWSGSLFGLILVLVWSLRACLGPDPVPKLGLKALGIFGVVLGAAGISGTAGYMEGVRAGGWLGGVMAPRMAALFGIFGSILVFSVLLVASLLLATNWLFLEEFRRLAERRAEGERKGLALGEAEGRKEETLSRPFSSSPEEGPLRWESFGTDPAAGAVSAAEEAELAGLVEGVGEVRPLERESLPSQPGWEESSSLPAPEEEEEGEEEEIEEREETSWAEAATEEEEEEEAEREEAWEEEEEEPQAEEEEEEEEEEETFLLASGSTEAALQEESAEEDEEEEEEEAPTLPTPGAPWTQRSLFPEEETPAAEEGEEEEQVLEPAVQERAEEEPSGMAPGEAPSVEEKEERKEEAAEIRGGGAGEDASMVEPKAVGAGEEDRREEESSREEKTIPRPQAGEGEPSVVIPRPEREEAPSVQAREEGPLSDPELLDRAAALVMEQGRASITMLQRKLQIRFAQASRLLDDLERLGVVGPYRGSLPREILMSPGEWEQVRAGLR